MNKIYCNVWNKYKTLKSAKISYILKKTLDLSIIYSKCGHKYKKNIQRRRFNWIEILKIIGLITNKQEYQKLYNQVWRTHKSRI